MAHDPSFAQTFAALGAWDDYGPPTPVKDEDEQEPYAVDPRPATTEAVEFDARIAELEAQLAAAKLDKERYLASRALITRLPPELLARAFELGVHDDLRLLPPINLVSRSWRQLALDTPTLWTYVKLDDSWGYGHAAAFIAHAARLLTRSGAAKLHVSLDLRYVDAPPELEQLLTALEPHLHRCFVFRASIPDWEQLALLRARAAPALGRALETLYLRLEPSDGDEGAPGTFLPPHAAFAHLRTLTLEHAPLLALRGARFARLESFTLTRDQRYHSSTRMGVPLAELLAFLRAHPRLRALRIQGVRLALDARAGVLAARPARVRVPALRTLALVHLEPAGVAALLEATALPALRRLALYMDYSDEADLACLACASRARFPALAELDLRNVNVDGPALFPFVRALRALPHLEGLGVCNPPNGALSTKLFDLLSRRHVRAEAPGAEDGADGAPAGDADGDGDADGADADGGWEDDADEEPGASNWLLPGLRALAFANCRDISGHEILRVVRARNGGAEPAPAPAAPGDADSTAAAAQPARAPSPAPAAPVRPEDAVAPIAFVRLVQCFAVDEQMAESIRTAVGSLQYWN